jgi:WD40 repeat protein
MAVKARCPSCGNSVGVPEGRPGGSLSCPRCGGRFTTAPRDAARQTAEGRPAGRAKDTAQPRETAGSPAGAAPPPDAGVPERVGRFEVRAKLGAGAFGTVYRAYDPQLDREVALKVPQAGTLDTPKRVERFLREARAAAGLRHPHIVPVYDAGQDGGQSYIASAFIKGRTLAEACDGGPLAPRRAAEVVRGLAEALAYAHGQGVVHRDVKPANVMLDEAGEPHLMDFGLAARQDTVEKLTHEGAVLGTPAYMAPEQAKGQRGDAEPAGDQYSLGVVLYELLCGEVPFEGPVQVVLFNAINTEPPPPRKLNPTVPRDLETVCLKAMAKQPRERYPTCRELADDLRRWLEDEPIRARRVGAVERLLRWARRNPALALTGAAAAGLLVAVALISAASAVRMAALMASVSKAEGQAKQKADEAQHSLETALASQQRAEANEAVANEQKEKAKAEEGKATAEAEKARQAEQKALESEQRAVAAAERARRSLYVAHLNLAQRAWDAGDLARVQQLLELQRPEPGKDDLRGFEWYHFWRLGHAARTLPPQEASIHAIAVSPDGRTLAVSDGKRGVEAWDLVEARKLHEFPRRQREYAVLAFSPDGKTLAVTDTINVDRTYPGVVELWDTATWQLRATLKGHARLVTALAFSPDGTRLASTDGGAVKQWDPADGKELRTIQDEEKPGFMACLTFTPEGKTLATATADDIIRLWNAQTGERRGELKGHTRWVEALAFAPDGRTLASAADDGTVRLWDTPRRLELAALRGHGRDVHSLAFSPDGKTLASGGAEGAARLWDVEAGRLLATLPHGEVSGRLWVAYAPAAGGLVTASYHTVKVWDETQAAARAVLTGRTKPFTFATLSGDGRALAAGGDDGPCRVWDAAAGQERPPLSLPAGQGRRAVFSPDGKTLAVAGRWPAGADKSDVGVRLWDVAAARERAPLRGTDGADALVFAPDGGTLALVAEGRPDARGVQLWDVAGGRRLLVLEGTAGARVRRLAFAPDGKTLASVAADKDVRLWDTATGKERAALAGHEATVLDVAFSPDGKVVAVLSGFGVRLYDAAGGFLVNLPKGKQFLSCVAFSADGRAVAAGSGEKDYAYRPGEVLVWDAATGKQTAVLTGHTSGVFAVAFAPDGRTVASGSGDGTVTLWDAATGDERLALKGGTKAVWVAFAAGGTALASWDEDGAVRLWRAATKEVTEAPPKGREPKAGGAP